MDVKLFARVAWRFKWLLLLTLALASSLAVLSTMKVKYSHRHLNFTARAAQTWQSSSVALVTQKGFPWGRSTFPVLPAPDHKAITPTYADPSRFSSLALLYTQLANGTDFQQLLRGVPGTVSAAPVLPTPDASSYQALPLISFDATARTGPAATTTADAALFAFQRYLEHRQASAGIPVAQRVSIEPVSVHTGAKLTSTSKKTVPLLVFVLILAGGFGMSLALENIRPRPMSGAAPNELVPTGLTPVARGAGDVNAPGTASADAQSA